MKMLLFLKCWYIWHILRSEMWISHLKGTDGDFFAAGEEQRITELPIPLASVKFLGSLRLGEDSCCTSSASNLGWGHTDLNLVSDQRTGKDFQISSSLVSMPLGRMSYIPVIPERWLWDLRVFPVMELIYLFISVLHHFLSWRLFFPTV